jgi:ATP-dependent protease HslVU (ClpYQ) peptidase subunit
MTCVVALQRDGVVYIGADSQGTSQHIKQTRSDPKVFKNGPFLIGVSGSFRYGQILRFKFIPPPHHPADKDDFEYMATDFVDTMLESLENGGFLTTKEGVKNTHGENAYGYALIGYKGKLYYFGSDFQIGMVADGYDAIGSGFQIALGAMWILAQNRSKYTPEEAIELALQAAAELNTTVGPPYIVLRSDL